MMPPLSPVTLIPTIIMAQESREDCFRGVVVVGLLVCTGCKSLQIVDFQGKSLWLASTRACILQLLSVLFSAMM